MTPRLLGRRLAMEPAMIGGVLIWNMTLFGGIAALYVFDLGPNSPLTAFPWLIDGGLATGAFLVAAPFVVTAVTSLRSAYVSIWFAGVALLGLLGLLSLNAGVGMFDWFFGLDDEVEALASVYIERSVILVWLLGMALATLHYVVPRSTGQPLAWGGIGILTFLTWLALAPIAGLSSVVDDSVPYAITTVGVVASMLLLVPAALAVVNLVSSMQGRWTLVFAPGAAAFATVGLAFLFGWTLVEAIGSLRAVNLYVGHTDWTVGAFTWATYGAFTFAALALAEHALPRILRRAWGGGFLSGAQLWLAFGGATVAGLALMGGGMAEAALLGQGIEPDSISGTLIPYRGAAFLGAGMIALAGLAFLVNLFLMYTSGQRAEYAVPTGSATATAAH